MIQQGDISDPASPGAVASEAKWIDGAVGVVTRKGHIGQRLRLHIARVTCRAGVLRAQELTCSEGYQRRQRRHGHHLVISWVARRVMDSGRNGIPASSPVAIGRGRRRRRDVRHGRGRRSRRDIRHAVRLRGGPSIRLVLLIKAVVLAALLDSRDPGAVLLALVREDPREPAHTVLEGGFLLVARQIVVKLAQLGHVGRVVRLGSAEDHLGPNGCDQLLQLSDDRVRVPGLRRATNRLVARATRAVLLLRD